MVVPFEKLYDYCDQLVEDDTVIYVFKEHGNKKIDNIRCLTVRNPKNWQDSMQQMCMLMHDQEPLHFQLYENLDQEEIMSWISNDFNRRFVASDQFIKEFAWYTKSKNLNFFLDGVNLCDKAILCHSEINSHELTKYENIGFIGCYWWAHAAIARDWFRFAKFDKKLTWQDQPFPLVFNIYNRSWSGTREYRLKFADMILARGIAAHSRISFNPLDGDCHYHDHIFANPAFRPVNDLEQLPRRVTPSTASATYDIKDYCDCAIDVVLETLFDDNRVQLTEKILRPIACGKPFILVSTPHSLRYLKSYGFETFESVLDESYDQIQDPLDRLDKIICTMEKLVSLDPHHRHNILEEMHRISLRNQNRFWSRDFAESIWGEFISNYQHAHAECATYMTGQRWLAQRKYLGNRIEDYKKIITGKTDVVAKNAVIELLRRVRGQ